MPTALRMYGVSAMANTTTALTAAREALEHAMLGIDTLMKADIPMALLAVPLEAKHMAERAIAQLRAAEAAEGWRPIAEAPKDRRIELFVPSLPKDQQIQRGRYNADEYASKPRPYWDYKSIWGTKHQRTHQPTHYMELPAPPAREGK